MPFAHEQFFEVFRTYNGAIWPAQVVAYLVGIVAVVALARPGRGAGQLVSAILALMWLWVGLGYHIGYFAPANPVAYAFGALFIVQAMLFVRAGVIGDRLSFRFALGVLSLLGVAFVFYAMVIYEMLGLVAGHGLMKGPLFGVAPCPTAIFTFGVLMMAQNPVPWWLLPIPVLWALIGTSAAVTLGVAEDFGLPVAAIFAVLSFALASRHR